MQIQAHDKSFVVKFNAGTIKLGFLKSISFLQTCLPLSADAEAYDKVLNFCINNSTITTTSSVFHTLLRMLKYLKPKLFSFPFSPGDRYNLYKKNFFFLKIFEVYQYHELTHRLHV